MFFAKKHTQQKTEEKRFLLNNFTNSNFMEVLRSTATLLSLLLKCMTVEMYTNGFQIMVARVSRVNNLE